MRSQTFENSNRISTKHSFSALLLLLITILISPEVNPKYYNSQLVMAKVENSEPQLELVRKQIC